MQATSQETATAAPEGEAVAETKAKTPILIRLWPLYILAAVFAAIYFSGAYKVLSLETLREQRETLKAFVENNLILAVAAYLGVYIIATVFMLPGALWITIAGGFLFGLVGGSIATTLGATMGACTLFLLARSSIGTALRERAGPWVQKMERGFNEDALSYMFAIRFMPVMPFPVANIAPAILGARFGQYVLTTALGIMPGVIAYTWIGAGLGGVFDRGETPDLAGLAANMVPALGALSLVSLIPVVWKKLNRKQAASLEGKPAE